jgi:hypothetical protein
MGDAYHFKSLNQDVTLWLTLLKISDCQTPIF